MVLNGEYCRLQKSNDRDAAYKLLHSTKMSWDELREFKCLLEANDNMDIDHCSYLVKIFVKEKNVESKRKHRGKDEERGFSHEEENDREYELFLERLKKHENSYMLEYEENGVSAVIKYEGESSSDRECDHLQPRRKLRSAMKQKDGPSDQMPRVENRGMLDSQSTPRMGIKGYPSSDKDCNLPKRMSKSATKPKTEHFNQMRDVFSDDSQSTSMEEMKKRTGKSVRYECKREKEEEDIMQLDPDYHVLLKNSKIINGHLVFTVGDHEVVYEERNGESIRENKEHDKESYSDVEILDSAFYDAGESNISNQDSTRQSEFRHKVITALRKPFDEKEYVKLCQDIELRKPVERHLDLRGGRDISYGKPKIGKSYLDYYPDLKTELLLVHNEKPKRLNLLRGFFLWLKHPESFSPWLDRECLAIYPESE